MIHLNLTVPEKGGVYIILQGSVEKLSLDPMSNEIVSETVK